MASTSNAFALLNAGGSLPSSSSKKKRSKKGSKKPSEDQTADQAQPTGPVQQSAQATAAVVAEATASLSKVANEDGFRPAPSKTASKISRANGSTKAAKQAHKDVPSVSTTIEAIERDAAGAIGPQRAALWTKWTQQLAGSEVYYNADGSTMAFDQVLLASRGLEASLQAALAQPLPPAELERLLALLAAALPALDPPLRAEVAAVLADLARALGGASPELLGLGQEAAASVAAALKLLHQEQAAGGTDGRAGRRSADSAAADAERAAAKVAAAEAQLGRARNAKEQANASGALLRAVEAQLVLGKTGALKSAEELLPADRFLAVLHARIHEGNLSGSTQSQLLEGLQQEEAMLCQQAGGVAAQIQSLETQLAALKQQSADIGTKLAQNQQRRKAIFHPIERGVDAQRKQAEEQQVMQRLQGLLHAIKRSDNAAGAQQPGGDAAGSDGPASAYLAALEQYLDATATHQAEASERVQFLLDRLQTASQQEAQLKHLNLGPDAVGKQTKAKQQLRSSLQEALESFTGCNAGAQGAAAAFQVNGPLLQRSCPPPAYVRAAQHMEQVLARVRAMHDSVMNKAALHTST